MQQSLVADLVGGIGRRSWIEGLPARAAKVGTALRDINRAFFHHGLDPRHIGGRNARRHHRAASPHALRIDRCVCFVHAGADELPQQAAGCAADRGTGDQQAEQPAARRQPGRRRGSPAWRGCQSPFRRWQQRRRSLRPRARPRTRSERAPAASGVASAVSTGFVAADLTSDGCTAEGLMSGGWDSMALALS